VARSHVQAMLQATNSMNRAISCDFMRNDEPDGLVLPAV